MAHMKTTFKFLLLFATILLVGCKKSPEEIFAEQKSGVVLICNEYYYDITLANGSHIYFTGLDADGDNINSWSDFMKKPCNLLRTSNDADTDGRCTFSHSSRLHPAGTCGIWWM